MAPRKRALTDYSKEELQVFRAEEKAKGMPILDQIEFWYTCGVDFDLTSKAEQKRQRLLFVWEKMKKGYPTAKIISSYTKEYGVTPRRAYMELADAKHIFGDMDKTDVQAEKHFVTQMAKETYRRAVKKKDLKAQNQAIANIIKAIGLDKIDPNAIDWDKLQPSIYPVVLDDNARHLIEKLVSGPSTDFGQLIGKFTEDAEDAEIDRGADQGAH